MKITVPHCLALLVAMLMLPIAQAQEAVGLQPRFVAGQSSRFELWTLRQQHVTLQVGANSREASSTLETTGEITWSVDRVEANGGATCTLTIDWLAMTITGPDGAVRTNDSRQATGDVPESHTALRAMTGTPLTFTMAADGSVVSVRGHDAINGRMPEGARTMEEVDFMELASELATIPFAPAELAANGAWNGAFRWPHELGWMQHDTQYRLTNVEQIAGIPVAMVSEVTKLRLEADLAKMGVPPDGPPVDVRLLNGSAQGQIMFDLSRREVVGRNATRTMRIQVQSPLPNAPVNIVQTIDENIQSQLLRVAENG